MIESAAAGGAMLVLDSEPRLGEEEGEGETHMRDACGLDAGEDDALLACWRSRESPGKPWRSRSGHWSEWTRTN